MEVSIFKNFEILLKSTALARRNFETTLSNNVFSASSFDHEANGGKVHISMLPNPSHLEAINPAAVGRSRAKAASKRIGDYGGQQSRSGDGVLCVQIHGDGAFTGQVYLPISFWLDINLVIS